MLLIVKTRLLKARDENSPEPDALRMRNFVPTVDQSPLAGCTSARLGIVDAGQRRARDCDCEAVRRQSSIHLQLASRLGGRRPRWPDQRACRWSAKEAERCVVGDRVRTGEDGGVDAAGLGTASGRDSRYALSAITRSAGRHSQEKRIQFQTHPHESKKTATRKDLPPVRPNLPV